MSNAMEVVDWDQVKSSMQTRVLDDGPREADPSVVGSYFAALCRRWETDPLFRAFVQQSYGNKESALQCVEEIQDETAVMEEAFNQFVSYDELALIAERENALQKLNSLKRGADKLEQ